MNTPPLIVTLTAILWLAGRYDASAAQSAPQVTLTGGGAGGQIYYQNGSPGVQLVRLPNLEEDVAGEAQTSSPVVREAAALNGSYRMSVDLPAGIITVSAVAPTYAYAEAYLYNNWFWANMDGSAQAHVNYHLDQVTVYGPFDAGTTVPWVIRSRVRGTLQAGPAGQGWEGKLARDSSYDVQAKANCRISANTGFDYLITVPANGAPAGGPPETIEQVIESTYQIQATVAGQTPPLWCPDVSVSISGQNGASGRLTLGFEIVLPRGYSYSSLLGTQMKVIYVNAQPSFTDAGGVTARADAGPQTVPKWASAITAGPPDEAGQMLTFVVTGNSNPSLFAACPAVAPDGTLTFTPAGVVGSAQITVVLKDDGGTTLGGMDTSTPHTFTIAVTEGNHPPVANAGGPYTIDQGNPLLLDGQASSDRDATAGDIIVKYEWDLNDDWVFVDATGATPTLSASALQILGLGFGPHPIHLRVTDSHGATGTASTTLMIRGMQTITFDPIADRVFGDASFTVNTMASSGLPVTLTSLTSGVATVSGNRVTIVGAGTAMIRASQAGDANWLPAANVERTFTVSKATPVIQWEGPADVNCTTPLGPIQLSATASVPGAFAYSPSLATYLSLGDAQTLTANFTPADSTSYESTSATTTINVRADAVGEVWVQRHAGTILDGADEVVATRVDANGNVIVTGRVSTDNGGDFYTAKYAAGNGSLIWERLYNGPDNMDDQATALELDASGNVVVTGISWSITGYAGFYTAKYATVDGALIWERRYDGLTPAAETPTAVAVDSHGDVVVTGESNHDFYTAKYDGTNGALLWEQRYNGLGNLANGSDKATALTVDAERNVIVTGYSLGTKSRPDYYTAKYSGSDGALLWERRYEGPGRFWDVPAAVAVDSTGNVVVAGSSTGDGTETDYYTAKYAAADGAIVWEQRYSGPVPPPEDLGSDDTATALAIDGFGNVVVTGHSTDALGNWEMCTLKYAAANGALIWEHRHHGPSPGLSSDEPTALLLDAHGNVVVAGSSTGPNWNQDFYLAKYAMADGALIWDKRFNAVYNETAAARARSVALASDNDVIVAGAVSMGLNLNDMLTVRFRPTAEPSITLNGPTSMSLALHSVFNESGATATDACGSPRAVTVTGSVNTSVAGTYALTYSTSDAVGQTATATRFVTVLQGSQTLNFAPLANHTYGDAWFDINATASSGLPVTFISLTPSVVTVSGNRVTIVGAGTAMIRASQAGDANWQSAADVDQPLTVAKTTPEIGWAPPAPITSSTPLSSAQLNATANVPGSFTYHPAAGTTLPRGTHTLSVDFTPGETANFTSASATVLLEVLNSAPVAAAQPVTTAEDAAVAVTFAGSDADGDALTFAVASGPAHGTLSGTTPNLTYRPAANYQGPDSFTFKVNDGTVDSAPATVSVSVTPVNDVPIAGDPFPLDSSSFGVAIELATGSNPAGVAVGDLDGDGRLDLVTANYHYQSGTVSVFRNLGAEASLSLGSFAPRVNLAAGPGTSGVELADVDGDGPLDIVVANSEANAIAVFRNGGAGGGFSSGSFDTPLTFATGSTPLRMAVGDVDGDGRPDVAVANFRSASVSVLRNTSSPGSISFAPQVEVPAVPDSQPDGVALRDVDGDGKADLAVATTSGGQVSIYRNRSTIGLIDASSFASRVDFRAGNGPRDVVLQDLDGDGKPDLAVANQSSGDVSVLRNTSTPGTLDANSFATEVRFPGRENTVRLIAQDLNADGKPDLAAVDGKQPGHLSVHLNTSTPGSLTASSFAARMDFNTGNGPSSLAAGDLDADGRVDVVVANRTSNTITVFHNTSVHVTTPEDEAIAVNLNGADVETDLSDLVFSIVTPPGHGRLTGTAPNLTYTPAANYHGPDSFTFAVNDGTVDSATATVAITVTPVNDAPEDRDRTVYVNEDSGGGQIQPLQDGDGDAVTYFVVTPPQHGRVELQGGNLIYLPDANYHGPDLFTFKGTDGVLESPEYSYNILVQPVNDLPTAQGQSLTTYDNQPLAITLSGADLEPAPLTYRIVTGPTAGMLSGTPPEVVYTPPFPYAGSDAFTFEVEDADGATASATVAITVLASDRPPVAVAGPDQQVVAGTDCLATVTVDGSASSDPDGDALSFAWELRQNGQVVATAPGQAVVSWSLTHGTYEAVLTVSTDQNGTVVSHSDSLTIEVRASTPALTTLDPAAAYADAGGPSFSLTVSGGCFLPGATVHWNGSPRPTTVVSGSQVTAVIPSSDLLTGGDVAVAAVQVLNGDGQVSNPLGFSLVPPTVGTADAAVAEPGTGVSVSTAPTSEGEPGVSVTVNNGGTEPVSVLAATYDEKPVGETAFRVDNGAFVDVQITGANPSVVASVWFYYPSDVSDPQENRVKLRYFNGTDWIPVRGRGGAEPVKDTTDNLNGTISGGRFEVIFDATSTPTIMELGGTVFGMFESAPQIEAITGPADPVALGHAVGVTVHFAVVGDLAEAIVRIVWDDGRETITAPDTATSATATHLYDVPGVYTVLVQVTDAEGDLSERLYEYVVIYDPSGGFVTGGGWIESPAGAYGPDPALTGRATFGFNSKYLKGQQVPSGQTQFQFQAGDFRFQSTAYEWLVVSGAKAQYRGRGLVNGTGDYGFLLTATDGAVGGGGEEDRFRIKIWERAGGAVLYDNRRGVSDDLDGANPQALGGGSIVIHRTR